MSASSSSLCSDFNAMSSSADVLTLKPTDLEIGRKYFVRRFKLITPKMTKFGADTCVLALLHFNTTFKGSFHEEVEVFLPRRFRTVLTEEKVASYNKNPDLHLVFEGVGSRSEFKLKLV